MKLSHFAIQQRDWHNIINQLYFHKNKQKSTHFNKVFLLYIRHAPCSWTPEEESFLQDSSWFCPFSYSETEKSLSWKDKGMENKDGLLFKAVIGLIGYLGSLMARAAPILFEHFLWMLLIMG